MERYGINSSTPVHRKVVHNTNVYCSLQHVHDQNLAVKKVGCEYDFVREAQ